MSFRRIAARMLARSPLPLLVRHGHRRELAILMFHGFASGAQQPFENLEHKHLEVEKWTEFAGWLMKNHRVLPLGEAVTRLEQGRALPDHALCVTMDDGFRSCHDLAFPVLERLQMPATIFLATEFVDEKRPIWVDRVSYSLVKAGRTHAELRAAKKELKSRPQDDIEAAVIEMEKQTGFAMPSRVDDASLPATQRSLDWDQIARMRDSGLVEFGSHTHAHRILGRCSGEVAQRELRASRTIIEERLGTRCDLFCYPNGAAGDFSPASEALVREAGYRCSLTTVAGRNAAGSSPFGLRRLGVDNGLDLARFQLMTTGVTRLLEGLRPGR